MEALYNKYVVKVAVDSAFNLKDVEYLIKISQKDPIGDSHGVLLNWAATSVWQLSEHGMQMIQGQFPRLKTPMIYEDFGERNVILNRTMLLYNYQTSTVRINHILNCFVSRTEGSHSYTHDITEILLYCILVHLPQNVGNEDKFGLTHFAACNGVFIGKG